MDIMKLAEALMVMSMLEESEMPVKPLEWSEDQGVYECWNSLQTYYIEQIEGSPSAYRLYRIEYDDHGDHHLEMAVGPLDELKEIAWKEYESKVLALLVGGQAQ